MLYNCNPNTKSLPFRYNLASGNYSTQLQSDI